MSYVTLRYMPSAKREYVQTYNNLTGGINVWDPPYELKPNEAPWMQNVVWRQGMLVSRKGQVFLNDTELGTGYATYQRLWHGYLFAHIGVYIYAFNVEDGTYTQVANDVPEIRGTFFMYNNVLYYKTRNAYKAITATYEDDAWVFTGGAITPYEPIILINADPYTGAGDLYQPENRISARKRVWYNAVNGVRTYYLPVRATRVTYVEVDGVQLTSGWSYNPVTGSVQFTTAPPVYDPPRNNTVKITYELVNIEAMASIYDCRFACVYGGTGELCVVMGGSELHPNAYYWSGNSDVKMDPTYFPIEQVQLAGATDEPITGFGKQQNNLIVFKERSIGKTTLGTQTINGRIYIDLPYSAINAVIGCNYPWSIQLVENNLVFANRRGVYMLLDTSAANENNVALLSRKVNGQGDAACLLWDLEQEDEDAVCSFDDGEKYYLTANERTWVWHYELSTYKDPSWFLFTNTHAVAYTCENDKEIYHINADGQLTGLQGSYDDYGDPINRSYTFPISYFGDYDTRKNINSVIIALGSYEQEDTTLTYLTDYDMWNDPTNLQVIDAYEYDEERVPGTRPDLELIPAIFRRRPKGLRTQHFSMQLSNNNLDEGFQLISAQIFYYHEGRLR